MSLEFFSTFKRKLRKRGNSNAHEELLPENDILLHELQVSEQDSNGFTARNETNHVDSCLVNDSASDISTDLYNSSSQLATVESTVLDEHGMMTGRRIMTALSRPQMLAFLGISLGVVSSLLFSVSSLMVKLATSVPSLEIVCMRLTLQFVFSLPAMIFSRDKFIYPWKKTRFLMLRAITGVTSMSLMFYSVKHMPLADARVIFYTSPIYTAMLGHIFLKESVTKFDVIATLLSLAGVVLIARPTFLFGSRLGESSGSKQVWFPALMGVLAAIFAAFSFVLVRKVSKEVGARVVVFYFSVLGSVISLGAALISGGFKYPDCETYDVLYIIACGFLGYFGQLFSSKALELEKAAVVSLVRTIGIVFSFILQLIALDVVPTGLSIGGALLVLLCNMVIFAKKYFDQKRSEKLTVPNEDIQDTNT